MDGNSHLERDPAASTTNASEDACMDKLPDDVRDGISGEEAAEAIFMRYFPGSQLLLGDFVVVNPPDAPTDPA